MDKLVFAFICILILLVVGLLLWTAGDGCVLGDACGKLFDATATYGAEQWATQAAALGLP